MFAPPDEKSVRILLNSPLGSAVALEGSKLPLESSEGTSRRRIGSATLSQRFHDVLRSSVFIYHSHESKKPLPGSE